MKEAIFPGSFEIWQYSTIGEALFCGLVAVGAVIGLAWGLRHERPRFHSVAWALSSLSLVGHGLTTWTLVVDPHRATGTVPLPQPFGGVAPTIALALMLLGPPVGAFLLTRAVVRVRLWRSQPALVLHALASTYAIYIGSWVGTVIFD